MTNHTFTIGGDMPVNRMGFGAMRITGPGIWGPPADKAGALNVLKTCVNLGVNFIDTADAYGPEVSENLIAEALYPYPEGLVIATKGGLTRQGPNRWTPKADPEYIENALKGSLKRLKLERIDLYQLHRFDPKVPMAETLGKLRELQQAGLIRHLGLSEVNEKELNESVKHIDVVSVQNRYSLRYRNWESALKWCEKNNVAFIPWYPLDAGDLENKVLQTTAQKHKTTVYQIAIAWLLAHSPVMLPIPGTSSVSHLQENMAAAELILDEEDLRSLEGIG
ncbi:MAG: aldo/keto reductase [Bacteroidia bacterium]